MAEIIDLAVRIEKNGEKAYRKARDEVSNPSLPPCPACSPFEDYLEKRESLTLGTFCVTKP